MSARGNIQDQSTAVGSCEVDSINIINHHGEVKDIHDLVTTITLTESLYQPHVGLKLGVLDESNFFEFFSLNGNEKIVLTIRQKSFGDNEVTIEMLFRVTNYPRYTRGKEGQSQFYIINGITESAYHSELKNISRGFDGPLINEIRRIVEKDLSTPLRVYGDSTTRSSGVYGWMSPMNQAMEFTNALSSPDGSPFYLYHDIHDNLNLRSYESIVNRTPYHTYYERVYREDGIGNNEVNEAESAYTIQELKSFLGLDRVANAKHGAYASSNSFFDLSTRTILRRKFDYNRNFQRNFQGFLTGRTNHQDNYSPLGDTKNFSDSPEMVQNNSLLNRHNFNGNQNLSELEFAVGAVMDSFTANLDTISHEMTVAGDLLLNPGQVIELDLPKATDLARLRSYYGDDVNLTDSVLSRKYMVTTSIHNIEMGSGNYQTVCKIVTDSIETA